MFHELIPYSEFSVLRLFDLARQCDGALPSVVPIENWNYMGGTWVGEGMGAFTEFLRPEQQPDELGAISLDLKELPPGFQDIILSRLGFPVRRGASRAEIESLLGEALRLDRFVEDRISLEFSVGRQWRYRIGCTVLHEAGLCYVSVIREDMLAEIDEPR